MSTETTNLNLIKPEIDEYYDVNILNGNLDKIDEYAGEINKKMNDGAIQYPAIGFGMNNVIQMPEIATSPTFDFVGLDYVNLLGKDGDCEDITKWNVENASSSLDSGYKVFGQNCIKITTTANTYGVLYKTFNIKADTCYMLSAYLKNGTANSVHINVGGYGTSTPVTQTSSMQRVCGRFKVSTATNMSFNVVVNGTAAGQYGYVDGAMLIEIPQSDNDNLTDAQLMAKYPYGESYVCLENPLFENKRYNLVMNGNTEKGIGYWTIASESNPTFSIENGKFKFVTSGYGNAYQNIKVKPNTNYYIKANISGGGRITVWDIAKSVWIKDGVGTFNTGNNSEIAVLMENVSAATSYFDSIMLVEGTTPPTEYLSCDPQRFVIEGKFTIKDRITIKDGMVTGLRKSKHLTLYGKDYDWTLAASYSGFKTMYTKIPNLPYPPSTSTVVKYDGRIIPYNNSEYLGDTFYGNSDSGLYIQFNNTDTGLIDGINPNSDESKAVMNGWKARGAIGSRYVLWRSMVDNSYPPAVVQTTATVAGTDTTSLTVADSTKFAVGDVISVKNELYYPAINSISGNVLTLSTAVTVAIGDPVVKCDNGTTNLNLLNYCKTNVAPGYEGYRIHYLLLNPEPVTGINTHIEGEIWNLVKGDNYVYVDSGIVLGEVANFITDNTYYYSNMDYSGYENTHFKNKTEVIQAAYKNQIDVSNIIDTNATAYGKQRLVMPVANFDINATYTVDYQILKTLHSQSFSILNVSYSQSLISTVESHGKELEQKQQKNSVLDDLIDLSMYEEGTIGTSTAAQFATWMHQNGSIFIEFIITFKTRKKVVPIFTISNIEISNSGGSSNGSVITDSCIVYSYTNKDRAVIRARTNDVNIINNIKLYGAYMAGKFIADCRGRV